MARIGKIFEKIGMDMSGNHAISNTRKSAISDAVKLTSIETTAMSYMPVDIDVSPMDNSRTKKEGVGRTYKGCRDLYGFTVLFNKNRITSVCEFGRFNLSSVL